MLRSLIGLSILLGSLMPAAATGADARCQVETHPWGISVECGQDDTGTTPGTTGTGGLPPSPLGAHYEYVWVPACPGNQPHGDIIPQEECGQFYNCLNPKQFMWALWVRLVKSTKDGQEEGPWRLVATSCEADKPTDIPAEVAVPQVTWQMVLSEIRRVGLPAMTVRVQPEGQTLVNFDTIFYTEPTTFTRTLRILGRDVEVEAQPSQFHWLYGDGASETTTVPGAPYPAKTIVHQYSDAHVTVHPSVDTVYTARFRVDGGDWQAIPETITIPGPPVDLRIREATPLLSGGG